MKNQICVAVFILFTITLFSQEKSEEKELPEGEIFISSQSVTIDGKIINLDAETGTLQLRDENDKPIALFGFTHYKQ